METFFSMNGRLNRLPYFGRVVAIWFMTYLIAFFMGVAVGSAGGPDALQNAMGLGYLIGLGGMIVSAIQVVKRLHDLGRPGTHYWLMLIPLYNIYFGLVLLFQKGTGGPNEYGADPLVGHGVYGSAQRA